MAVTEQRQLYNPQIEALATQYGTALGDIGKRPLTGAQITSMAPQVAPQTALQQQATTLTGAGIGAYAPYVTAAGSPGPLDRNTPSGLKVIISSALVLAGKTVILHL